MADALSTIRSRIALRLGNRSNLNSTIDQNINEAILQVIWRHRPYEMQTSTTFTTSEGDFDYTIGSGGNINVTNLYSIEMVRNNTDNVRLRRGAYYDFEDQDQSKTGQPHKWFRRGNTLYLYNSVPDSTTRTIKVSYLKRHTVLDEDTDTFPLNDEWLKPVEHLATAMCWLDLNDTEKGGAAMNAYEISVTLRDTPLGVEDQSDPESSFLIFDPDAQ